MGSGSFSFFVLKKQAEKGDYGKSKGKVEEKIGESK